MKLLFAPVWMMRAVQAAGESNAVLLNIPKLLDIVSLEDVKVYLRANLILDTILPEPLAKSFHTGFVGDGVREKHPEIADKLSDLDFHEQNIKGLLSKNELAEMQKFVLSSVVLNENTLLIYQTSVEGDTDLVNLYEGVLSSINNFYRLEDFAREPITVEYLRLKKEGLAV